MIETTHPSTQQYLIWATGFATYEIGRLQSCNEANLRKYGVLEELIGTARQPLGAHKALIINGQVLTDLRHAGLLESTPYWMAGTKYVIWAISDETADRLRQVSAETIAQRAAKETVERDDERKTANQTTPLCPLCHSYCYGDCQAN